MDRLIAFIATARPDEAKAFYRDAVGLSLLSEKPYSLVFLSGETMLRIQKVAEVRAAVDTTLGWEVTDIAARMVELEARGVVFERFDGFPQDGRGVWTGADGTMVAWFRDPDGNLLSLTQFGR
jgi:catechol 2,3-dioxygenase-like lactoylglutathione lyase family enzyme